MFQGFLRPASLLAMVVCASLSLFGQGTGSITGTVRDNSGAVMPNAQVTITSTEQGISYKTTTNNDGEYLQAAIPPGSYDVNITAAGFNTFETKGIVLRVSEKTRVDATLTPGAVKTTVEIQGAATQVQTETAELSGVVTGKEITQIVLNGRDFAQLITLTPGVNNQTGQDEGTVGVNGSVGFSVNGGRTEYNNWLVDGGDNMDAGSNGTINVYPSVDAIAEVKVLTSNYGAQYGRNGSGTVETVTKSGTKEFHGDLYEFVRNTDFNARNFFATSNPVYQKNDFGYTLGGPAYIPHLYNRDKEKTFFFWSEEWRKEIAPQTFDVQVPSSQERQGNFSDVCPAAGSPVNSTAYPNCPVVPAGQPGAGAYYPNNTVPIDPNAAAMLPMIPAPTTDNGFSSYYNGSVSTPTDWREELFRIDHNFSETEHFFFRFIHDSWNTITPTSLWSGDSFPTEKTNFVGPGVSMVAHMASSISPTLLNEFTFSYTTDHIFLTPSGVVNRPSSMTMTGLFDNGFGGKLPGVQIGSPYNFTADLAGYPWNNANPTYTYRDQIAKIVGGHNIYAGFYFEAMQKNEDAGAETQGYLDFSNTSSVSTGNSWADFLLGRINSFNQTNVQIKYYYRSKVGEPYVQDDWHVTPKLTLNLGLRISLFGTYPEKYHNFYNFFPSLYNPAQAPAIDITGSVTGVAGDLIPGSGNFYDGMVACGTGGTPAGCMKNHLFNPAPRFGFAWDPFGNGKWAIRGGYGIFFEHLNGNEAISGLEGNPPGMLNPYQYNIPCYTCIGGAGLVGTTSTGAYAEQVMWPYVQQWHFDVQHDLAQNTVGTVSYVGSKGTHLSNEIDLNQLQPVPMSDNPFSPGEPLTSTICGTVANAGYSNVSAVVNGHTVTGLAAQDISVACNGSNANPYRPYLGYSNIGYYEQEANSIYNALQVSLRRTSSWSQLNVAYSYSHSLDDSSDHYDTNFVDSYNLALTRASSNFDERHILTVGYVIDLPLLNSHKGFVSKAFGGWQWSGLTSFHTGTPFSVLVANGNNLVPGPGVGNGIGQSGGFADVVGNPWSTPPQAGVYGVLGPMLYNPTAFAAPTGLTFGDAGRNLLRNPSDLNFDMGLFKNFYVTEKKYFEFRAEAFNVFNHTEFSGVQNTMNCYTANGSGCSDPSNGFLMPNAAHESRKLQLSMKFIF